MINDIFFPFFTIVFIDVKIIALFFAVLNKMWQTLDFKMTFEKKRGRTLEVHLIKTIRYSQTGKFK